MEKSKPSALPHSNTPLYLPSFLRQYGKEVKDYRQVNFTTSLPSYQLQFMDMEEGVEGGPEQVFFSFMGKNCWLWEDEYCLLENVLDRVEQMTIRYQHRVNVGPLIPVFTQESEQVEDVEQDLCSGFFKVQAVLRPSASQPIGSPPAPSSLLDNPLPLQLQ